MTQQQPRRLFARGELYLSYFRISRQGLISEHLVHAHAGARHFSSRTLSDEPRANGFLGGYQALASTATSGYALWNDGRSGRLEIRADRFAANR